MSGTFLREVFETEQFALEKPQISPDPKRADEILRNTVIFALARDPECGQTTLNPEIRAFVIYPSPLAGFIIYYSFTETQVALISLVRVGQAREDLYGD